MYIITDLEPIGCYIDTGVRDLEGPYITTSDMTPEKCVRWCNTQEYSYAGLQVWNDQKRQRLKLTHYKVFIKIH